MERKTAVSQDLVRLRHRGWSPTALRLSPLQFRVLKMLKAQAAIIKQGYTRAGLRGTKRGKSHATLIHPKKGDIRMHLGTFKSLERRELIAPADSRKHGLVYAPSTLATAALEVYEL